MTTTTPGLLIENPRTPQKIFNDQEAEPSKVHIHRIKDNVQQHAIATQNHKTYRFFKNLYDYEQKPVLLIGKHKLDAATGQHLPKNQQIFRRYDYLTQQTTYFYRTNEKLAVHDDFQEFLITRLLLLCKSAEFTHIPLEQDQVPKEVGQCNQLIYTHFQTKPVLHFTFLPEQASLVRQFINQLDTYAQEYDMTESQEFCSYPISHDQKHEIIQQSGGTCPCDPIRMECPLEIYEPNQRSNRASLSRLRAD
ncbi:11326_t:CDS:2 [Racocetra fulgida]|uniref:11326_t:CDS:1 n=1 Tax=Racocetra fulgida TaxID=60492 RepID=A0A9N8VDQ3_9GLOM|nr:11326_t:CDS:2 [Racocetra fulgida]